MLNLLIWAAIIYFGYRIYQSFAATQSGRPQQTVKGERKRGKKLDIDEKNIEDASFRDLRDDGSEPQ